MLERRNLYYQGGRIDCESDGGTCLHCSHSSMYRYLPRMVCIHCDDGCFIRFCDFVGTQPQRANTRNAYFILVVNYLPSRDFIFFSSREIADTGPICSIFFRETSYPTTTKSTFHFLLTSFLSRTIYHPILPPTRWRRREDLSLIQERFDIVHHKT